MYLQRDQDWRRHSTLAHIRDQCDHPPPVTDPLPIPRPLRVHRKNAVVIPVVPYVGGARSGKLSRCLANLAQFLWGVAVYGVPTSAGEITWAIWNRRDVLVSHVLPDSLLATWDWNSRKPDAAAQFFTQLHENAKLLRASIAKGLVGSANAGLSLGVPSFCQL